MKRLISILLVSISVCSFASNPATDEITALRTIADSLHSIGKSDSAIIVGRKAISLAEKNNDKVSLVGSLAGQGVYLRSVGKVEEALKSYDEALEIASSPDFKNHPSKEAIEEIASLYINLAVLDLDMQHKEEAAENALKAGEWCAGTDDAAFRATVFGVVGSVLTGCGNLEEAGRFQALAYADALSSENEEAAFRAAAYSMLISDRKGDTTEAARWREICQSLLPGMDSLMAKLMYYQAECSICLKNDDRKGALVWFDRIVRMDGIDNLPFVKFDAYNNMHLAYAGLGDYREAYETLLKGNELRDTIWEHEKAESLRDLTVKYRTKETELALAQSESRRATTLMWLFISLGIILAVIVVFILYASRQRRIRMQKEIEYARLQGEIGIELTKQYVEGLETERERMARELHDGVCNDLLAVEQSLHNGHTYEEAERMIAGCRESVRRISHELLPPEFTYASLDEVIGYFVRKQEKAAGGQIEFHYLSSYDKGSWEKIPDDVSLEIYRIVQEAVGNAVKHSGADRITVELFLEEGILQLKVTDNGRFKPSEGKGAGLGSIRKRVNSINGELTIKTSENEGSEVTVRVKTK